MPADDLSKMCLPSDLPVDALMGKDKAEHFRAFNSSLVGTLTPDVTLGYIADMNGGELVDLEFDLNEIIKVHRALK